MSINIDNQQEVDDLFTLLLKSLFALMQSQGITLDFEVNHRRNILVYLGLFKSNSFNKFLEELFDNEDFEALSMENQIIILYQYVLSYTSLVMIYNEQLDQEYVIDHTPTVINISHYHRKVKKRKGQTPLVGQFVDKYIGREKFFLGVNILSTLAVTIGLNKISSLAFNTEFNLKDSVAQSVATGVLMFGYYVFNKLFSSSKADKKKSKSWGNN